MKKSLKILVFTLIVPIFLISCTGPDGKFKLPGGDARKTPADPKKRVEQNLKEGRGFRLGGNDGFFSNKARGVFWTKPDRTGKEVVRDEKIDEAAYSEFIEDYKKTYFKEVFDVLSKKYKLGRVRILLKQPRSTLSWHRDPEPRLHIPIITNPGSIMVIDNVAKHLPADGSVWITNNTKYHNAFNGGEENRIHLVACVLNHKFN